MSPRLYAVVIHLLVFAAGVAALSWEVLWQIEVSLAMGVSALGTAVTLVATMGGMTAGALFGGRWLRGRSIARPARVYAILEAVIGLSGVLLLAPGARLLSRIDAVTWRHAAGAAPLVQLVGLVLLLGVPTFAMGVSIPVFGLIAARWRGSAATQYAANT